MRNYFCGWYFKMQSNEKTLAIIPSYHNMHRILQTHHGRQNTFGLGKRQGLVRV